MSFVCHLNENSNFLSKSRDMTVSLIAHQICLKNKASPQNMINRSISSVGHGLFSYDERCHDTRVIQG